MNSQFNLDHSNNTIRNWLITGLLTLFVLAAGMGLAAVFVYPPLHDLIARLLDSLLKLQSTQVMWYITRSAGLVAYLLLWLSTVWGLAVSSKIFDGLLHRAVTYDFHQFLSLLAIGFLLLHMVALLFDQFLPYNLSQLLVPFLSPYRPIWVGIGVIGFYLTILVTVTFYVRGRIGMRAFRAIHVTSLIAYLGATVHGFFAGTDSPLLATQWMYAGTLLVTVFLTTYWLILRLRTQPD